MSRRIEMKFRADAAHAALLRQRLEFYASPDPHAVSHGAYPVFSQYFDTENLDYFYDKIDGEFRHVKIRVRRYSPSLNGDGPAWLEAKIKDADNQKKLRIRGPLEVLSRPERWSEINHPDIQWFLNTAEATPLVPVCNIYYEREAYAVHTQEGVIRINIDSAIAALYARERRATQQLVDQRALLPAGHAVLEVKHHCPELPKFIQEELRLAEVRRGTFSKYADGLLRLDALNNHHEVRL